MSNPTVSLRLSNYHLARALRAIRTIEPSWQCNSTATILKTILYDYIAKSELQNNHPLTVPEELLKEIVHIRNFRKQSHLQSLPQLGSTASNEKLTSQTDNRTPRQRLMDEQGEAIIKAEAIKTDLAIPPNTISTESSDHSTDSTINTVSNFSPPPEWTSGDKSGEE